MLTNCDGEAQEVVMDSFLPGGFKGMWFRSFMGTGFAWFKDRFFETRYRMRAAHRRPRA